MIKNILLVSLAGAAVILAGGCNGTAAPQAGQVVQLQDVKYAAAFEAALDTMREHFAIEKADRQSGEILARPSLYTGDEPSERLSTGLSKAKPEMRRMASLQLASRPEGLAVEVLVNIERRDTQDYQVYEGILANEDLRMRTPAERRDTAGPDQRDVWTFVRRDRQMEELLLRRMHERLGLLSPSHSGPPDESAP